MKAENINKTELLELASRIDSISINSVSALLNFISDPHRILYAHFAFQYFVSENQELQMKLKIIRKVAFLQVYKYMAVQNNIKEL